MDRWKVWFILLLPPTFYLDSKATFVNLEKTVAGKQDVTPICTDEDQNIVMLIVCSVRTERNGREECRLLYRYGQNFGNTCDSRFTIAAENQTVFLHLTGLAPADSGSYTCECSRSFGTLTLHLNITVEEDEDNRITTQNLITSVLVGVTIVVVISGVILGVIHRTKRNGVCSRSATSGSSVCETPSSLEQDDPYTSLQQPASDLYQTFSYSVRNTATGHRDTKKMDSKETDKSFRVYKHM